MSNFNFRPVRGTPFVVMNIVAINVIFFVAKYLAWSSQQLDLGAMLGLYHPFNPDFHWYQFLTSMFMHAGFTHILFNMFGVWFFGRMLENVWGAKRFLIYYLICGLGASLIYIGWETFSAVSYYNKFGDGWELIREFPPLSPMVGASGAVFGLLIGAALLFPNSIINIYGVIPLKLKWLAVIYGAAELYSGYKASEGDHVAHFAHIGGMIFGFILVQIYKRDKNKFY